VAADQGNMNLSVIPRQRGRHSHSSITDEKLSHMPCDIALVNDATAPGEDEGTSLSVLDLVKHACRTIMATMTEED
jgi:hypothetical protein